ncbi:MAG: glycosyltransferase family 2 protein [Agathobacter sp.]|nr:glycosyltransferase family 2 protein [Agathobacter sp.]
MSSNPLVSVVIPVYNVEKYLARCLDSVLAQDYMSIEIICVNDCSTDNSAQLLQKYEAAHANIRVVMPEKNGGLGAARDLGMESAAGEYICFLDSDDYIAADFVSRYVEAMGADTDIVIGSFLKCMGDKQIAGKIIDSEAFAWVMPSAVVRLYRLDFLRKNGIDFRGLRYYEDGIFNLRCMVAHPRCRIINYSGYYYMVNAASITQNRKGEMLFETYISNYRALAKDIKWNESTIKDHEILEYEYVQGITICMIYNLRHAGVDLVEKFVALRREILQELFPEWRKNRLLKIGQLKGDSVKNRAILLIFLAIEKMHLSDAFLRLIAR